MEVMDSIMQSISTIGFPIVAFLLMWRALMDEKAAHKEEIALLKESLDNNTNILTKLYERMEVQ